MREKEETLLKRDIERCDDKEKKRGRKAQSELDREKIERLQVRDRRWLKGVLG